MMMSSLRTPRHTGTAPISLLVAALAAAALPLGCAASTHPDPTVRQEIPGDLGVADRQQETPTPAIRKELRDLISDGYSRLEGMSRAAVQCLEEGDCTEWNSYAGALVGIAARAPEDPYVQGQVVYSLVRGGRHDVALIVLDSCQAPEWWCHALEGFTLAESGQIMDSETAFEKALREMPDEDLCKWTDLQPLVPGDTWSAYEGLRCSERLERSGGFWWLADPAWILPGNDRKVEHYNRVAWAALHSDALSTGMPDNPSPIWGGHTQAHQVEVVRHGMDIYRWDARWGKFCSWPTQFGCHSCVTRDQEREARRMGMACCPGEWPWPWCVYTPPAPTYRVMPEERALLDPFHATAEDWPLVPGGQPENYLPQAGALFPMDAQVAFFERQDSLVAAAATEVPDDPIFQNAPPDSAILFLGTDHDESPATVHAKARNGRWVFRAGAPLRRYVVSIETVTLEAVGRFRSGHGLPHNPMAPLRLSDLLLYLPEGPTLPDSLEAALPLMKGGHRWSQGQTMGVFLEVYGNREAASFEVSVELERERGGLARIGEVLGIVGGRPVNVQWVEAAGGSGFALSFTVDLGEAEAGDHTLRVSVTGPGLSPATVQRSVRIVPQ